MARVPPKEKVQWYVEATVEAASLIISQLAITDVDREDWLCDDSVERKVISVDIPTAVMLLEQRRRFRLPFKIFTLRFEGIKLDEFHGEFVPFEQLPKRLAS